MGDETHDGSLVAAVLAWREARLRRLTSPDGWLSLVDRIELHQGANALPFGTAWVDGAQVRLQLGRETVLRGGLPASDGPWADDGKDVLVHAGRRYELIRREGLLAVRVKDPSSAALRAFAGIPCYPIVPKWRIQADLMGEVAQVALDGGMYRLRATREGERMSFLFGDLTNRDETYGAGRFVYGTLVGAGRVEIDFNQAFNPPCAFTPYVVCPRVPPEERLPVRITAGEKRPTTLASAADR